MSKIIVLTGHGVWDPSGRFDKNSWLLGKKQFAQLPGGCTMHFYTSNFTLLRNDSGKELDKGNFNGVKPDQTAGPYKNVPNMALTWPSGLTLGVPPKDWDVVKYSIEKPQETKVPSGTKNLQFQIKKPSDTSGNLVSNPFGRLYLDDLFKVLIPAVQFQKDVLLVWSACRQVGLKDGVKDSGKRQFKPSNLIEDDMWELCIEDWDEIDRGIATRVKVWIGQQFPIDEKSLYRMFGVPEKLKSVTDVKKRAKLEKKWRDVWKDIRNFFSHNPFKKEMEKLNLAKRQDALKFRKAERLKNKQEAKA